MGRENQTNQEGLDTCPGGLYTKETALPSHGSMSSLQGTLCRVRIALLRWLSPG